MEVHHDKHHQTYVNGFNAATEALAEAQAKGDARTAAAQAPLINFHGGGHLNHSLFWENLAPNGKGGGGEPQGKLMVCVAATSSTPLPPSSSVWLLTFPVLDADCHQGGFWIFRQPQEADQCHARRHPGFWMGLACQG